MSSAIEPVGSVGRGRAHQRLAQHLMLQASPTTPLSPPQGGNPLDLIGRLLQSLLPMLQMVEQLLAQAGHQSPLHASPASQRLGHQLDHAQPAHAQPAQHHAPAPAPSPAAPAPQASHAPSSVTPVAPSTGGPDMTPKQVAETYKAEIDRASQASGIPANVLAGMIWQESKGVPDTPGGGLLQLGDNEFQHYGGGTITNPADNIMAGAMYMKDLVRQFGDVPTALRAYNSGPNGVDRADLHATPAGTGDPTYVDKVMGAAEAAA